MKVTIFFINILWLHFISINYKILNEWGDQSILLLPRIYFYYILNFALEKKNNIGLIFSYNWFFSSLIQVFQNHIIISKYTLASITIVIVGWVNHNYFKVCWRIHWESLLVFQTPSWVRFKFNLSWVFCVGLWMGVLNNLL